MAHRFASVDEHLQIRRGDSDVPATAREQAAANPPAWMTRAAATILRNPTHDQDGCGLSWCGWNGDRARGWAFYCACGFCTPMKRSFSDGMDAMEAHWQASWAKVRRTA